MWPKPSGRWPIILIGSYSRLPPGRALPQRPDDAARQRARAGWRGMTETALTPDRILDAAEDVLRRFGPAKATVVYVAQALGVSHGSVYRHFPSKAALRDAVTARWLERIAAPLAAVAAEDSSAPARLPRWLDFLIAAKRRLAREDPELFATYLALAAEARAVVQAHVDHLAGQIAQIIADGVAHGEFTAVAPVAGVWSLVLRGLRAS